LLVRSVEQAILEEIKTRKMDAGLAAEINTWDDAPGSFMGVGSAVQPKGSTVVLVRMLGVDDCYHNIQVRLHSKTTCVLLSKIIERRPPEKQTV
jgi:hypothetical protein